MKPIPHQQLTNARIMERIAKAMREHGGDERMAAHYERKAERVRRAARRNTWAVGCHHPACVFVRQGLSRREAAIEAISHGRLNPDHEAFTVDMARL